MNSRDQLTKIKKRIFGFCPTKFNPLIPLLSAKNLLNAIANTARQYFDDNEIYAYITNDCKYHRVEGYTITGIKIRFIRKGPKILNYFPVVETTYENATRDLLPYSENEDN